MNSQTLTMQGMYDFWKDLNVGTTSEAHRANMLSSVRYWIHLLGDTLVLQVDRILIERYRSDLLARRARATAAGYLKNVRRLFSWSKDLGVITADPFDGVPNIRKVKGRNKVYSIAEVDRIHQTIRAMGAMNMLRNSHLWEGRVKLAQTTGMRRGEVLNLLWADINFQAKVITVRYRISDAHITWAWSPKDDDSRVVPLMPEVEAWLNERRAYELQVWPAVARRWQLPIEWPPYPFLRMPQYAGMVRSIPQLSEKVRGCPEQNFSRTFRKILDIARIPSGTFHCFRKTFSTALLRDGMSPKDVIQLTGHADVETLMEHYTEVDPLCIQRAALALDRQRQREIGETGLEPATSRPPAARATKLRHSPEVPAAYTPPAVSRIATDQGGNGNGITWGVAV